MAYWEGRGLPWDLVHSSPGPRTPTMSSHSTSTLLAPPFPVTFLSLALLKCFDPPRLLHNSEG